ncbi:MAG: hypothetical protein J6X93_04360 [Bacilli bacterium]|nr:hypothetical protein [Bacilli bacterium]
MEFENKVYHSKVFKDCSEFLIEGISDVSKQILSFGYEFLAPIENYLENYKEYLDSHLLLIKMRDILFEKDKFSNLKIYKDVDNKVKNYLEKKNLLKKPLQYYSWILDSIIKSINNLKEWRIISVKSEQIFKTSKELFEYQAFLSYSSIDKALSFWIFQYFKERNIFLYVDWMFGKYYDNGVNSKDQLEIEIKNSIKFIYLRTLNSEISSGKYTRSWCGWEIGRSYQYHVNNQYICDDFAIGPINSPSILDGFKEFTG